jgi:electron transfer flavoprotein alpha subunit
MKIVCLVKQVPSPEHVRMDEESGKLVREGVPLQLNSFDVHAVTEGIRLRDELGGEVVVLTMGPPQAEEVLRTSLAMGADRAIHLSDKVFAVADTLGTSRTLAMAIEKAGADLVICGRKTVDAETWQVPPETAAFLGWPQLTNLESIESAGDGFLRVRREDDEGFDTYELPLPAVVSVTEAINKGIRPAKSEVEALDTSDRIVTWSASDLADDVDPDFDKRFGQPGSPTRVLAARDVTPERAGEVVGTPGEAAERVLARLGEVNWPPRSSWDKPDRLGDEPGDSYDCWSVVELLDDGTPRRLSLELLGKGRELAGKLGGANCALVLGSQTGAGVREAARHGAERVYVVEDEALGAYEPEPFAAAVRRVVASERPHVLLIPSSARGRDYGPRVAGELELGMTADCVDLAIDKGGRLIQTKPAYGGSIVSIIMGRTTPQLATVRSGMFAPVEPRDDHEAEVVRLDVGRLPEPRVRLLDRRHEPDTAGYELDDAEHVLCVGKGIGGPEALPEIEALASRLGAAVGGTRGVTGAGWLPKNRQIGLTGRAVAPALYIAVGVRGAFEHVVGSMKAGVIVAVNADEDSRMFEAADVGVVGDWRETLPTLVASLEGRLSGKEAPRGDGRR